VAYAGERGVSIAIENCPMIFSWDELYADWIFHAHANDLEIRRDALYRNGSFSGGMAWQVPRLLGLGEVDWPRFVAGLYAVGYDHVVSVEHEDRNLEVHGEGCEAGFCSPANTLRPLFM
jgi:sugar phosphate isomerase/epimerase